MRKDVTAILLQGFVLSFSPLRAIPMDDPKPLMSGVASFAMYGAAACMILGFVVAILGANGYLP